MEPEGVGAPVSRRMGAGRVLEPAATSAPSPERAVSRVPAEFARMRALVEVVPDAMVVVDARGLIVMINSEFERLLGWTPTDLLGQSIAVVVPERFRAVHQDLQAEYLRDPGHRRMGEGRYLCALRGDGTEQDVEISLGLVRTDEEPLVCAVLRHIPDVSDRRKADEAHSRLAALVEGSDDAIISTTLDDVVTSWNGGAESLFGYSEQEMLGRPLSRLLPPAHRSEDAELLAQLRRGDRVPHRDSLRRTKDGRDIIVSMSLSPIHDRVGALIGGSNLARDITERKNAEVALTAAKDSAETALRDYEAFSYSVAHDLRAPLRALDGFSHQLVDRYGDELDDAGREHLRRIRESAQYMAELIDGLLLARISRHELVREPVDLSALAEGALARLSASSPERRVDLIIEPDLIGPGDRGLLGIVFENLLGNAWKFSRRRAPARIEFGRASSAQPAVYFIRDNGAGSRWTMRPNSSASSSACIPSASSRAPASVWLPSSASSAATAAGSGPKAASTRAPPSSSRSSLQEK